MPRHLGVLQLIVAEGQKQERFIDIPFPQVIGLCGGGMVMPILLGGALLESGALTGAMAHVIEKCFIADAGIDQRIDLALKALAPDPSAAAKRTTKKRGKS